MMKTTAWRCMKAAAMMTLVCATVNAATYVVDNANPRAADANDGSPATPWKTIQHAADTVQPGDIVCVMEGRYDERVRLQTDGADGAKIVFKAVPRRTVEMHGFVTGEADYVRIEGFNISSPHLHNGIEVAGRHVEIVDNYFTHVKAAVQGAYGEEIEGTRDWSDCGEVLVKYNQAFRTQYGIVLTGDAWRVESNEVRRLNMYVEAGQGDCDYTRTFGRDHKLRWNYFHGTDTKETGRAHVDGAQVFTAHNLTAHNVLLEQNVICDFGQGFMGSSSVPGAVSDFTFRRNIFACGTPKYGGAWGICSAGLPNTVVENNTFSDLIYYAVGIVGDGVTGGEVRNNICANMDTSIVTAHGRHTVPTETAIEHNLIHNTKPSPAGGTDTLDADPMFVDREARNFRLQLGSPAIDAGADGADIGALAHPNVYYVDPRHPAASDNLYGYAAVPFKTLAKACEVAGEGETIVLRGGVYREVLAPKAGVSVRAMPGEHVVLSGADLVEGWTRDGDAWSAPLPARPVRVLRGGEPLTDYKWSDGRITIRDTDPRLHTYETVARETVSTGEHLLLEGIEARDVLSRN